MPSLDANTAIPPSIPIGARSLEARDRFLDVYRHPDILKPRACYVCGQSLFTPIATHDRYGIPYPTGLCTHCGNVQQTHYYDADVLTDFYMNYYRDIYGALAPAELFDHQVRRNIFEFMSETVGVIDRVLEVGAGAGGNLSKFKAAGCEVLGLDFDQRYLDEGSSRGLTMLHGGMERLEDDDRFDLVIIAHVLEHIDGPTAFLEEIGRHLTPTGRIYIEVPSLNQVSEGGYDYDLATYFQNAHTIHFTELSLSNVCALASFTIGKHDTFIRAIAERAGSDRRCEVRNDPDDSRRILAEIDHRRHSPLRVPRRVYKRLKRRVKSLLVRH